MQRVGIRHIQRKYQHPNKMRDVFHTYYMVLHLVLLTPQMYAPPRRYNCWRCGLKKMMS